MKTLRILVLPLVALLTAFHGCVKPENIIVHEVENIRIEGLSQINLVLRVENRGRKACVESAKFNLMRGQSSMIDMVLRERVEVPRRTTSSIPVSLQLKAANPLAAIALAQNPRGALSSMQVSGEIVVKAGVRKKIRFSDMPFPEFLRILGADSEQLNRYLAP